MTILKGVCLASGAALHVAPLPTMREIQAAKSTLNFHIAPYASTLLNHTVNLWYAIIRRDGPLIIHRICGICAQSYYLQTYLTFCPPAKAADNRKWISWVFAILGGIFCDLHVVLPLFGMTQAYNSHIALFGAITGIGLAASPLATVVSPTPFLHALHRTPLCIRPYLYSPPSPSMQREVLRNRDASSLPFHLCAMVFTQCSAWTVYGWLRDDWSTFANNLVGVILGSLQLLLIYMYGSSRDRAGGAGSGVGEGKEGDKVPLMMVGLGQGVPRAGLGDTALPLGVGSSVRASASADRLLASSPTQGDAAPVSPLQGMDGGGRVVDVEAMGSAGRGVGAGLGESVTGLTARATAADKHR